MTCELFFVCTEDRIKKEAISDCCECFTDYDKAKAFMAKGLEGRYKLRSVLYHVHMDASKLGLLLNKPIQPENLVSLLSESGYNDFKHLKESLEPDGKIRILSEYHIIK